MCLWAVLAHGEGVAARILGNPLKEGSREHRGATDPRGALVKARRIDRNIVDGVIIVEVVIVAGIDGPEWPIEAAPRGSSEAIDRGSKLLEPRRAVFVVDAVDQGANRRAIGIEGHAHGRHNQSLGLGGGTCLKLFHRSYLSEGGAPAAPVPHEGRALARRRRHGAGRWGGSRALGSGGWQGTLGQR